MATPGAAASSGPGPSASTPEPASSSTTKQTYSGPPRLVVFGGNGFVGSRVCEEALKTGLAVVSINRSGPPKSSSSWVSDVEWVSADVFDQPAWNDKLEGAVGAVSCLGGFGSNEQMYRICGQANIAAIEAAAEAGVPRFAFISVHEYNLPDAVRQVGYFRGKKAAERALAEKFPEGGVAVRPGFIHGRRLVGSVSIPLDIVGVPLEKVLGALPTQNLANIPILGLGFVPPVSVRAVARAAVSAATDPSVPAGILDVWQIQKQYGSA